MSSALNQAKAASGPEQWLPPTNTCRYITAWAAVKIRWSLSVDPAEQAALIRLADACPNETLAVQTVDIVPVAPQPVVPIAPGAVPAGPPFRTSPASSGSVAPTGTRPPPRSWRTPSRPARCRWSSSPPASPTPTRWPADRPADVLGGPVLPVAKAGIPAADPG
jgi:hypothetical protein